MEENKLIAEFIGRKIEKTPCFYTFEGVSDINNGDPWYRLEDSEFDSDWNWLMKVVKKIESVLDGEITFQIEDTHVLTYNLDRSFHEFISKDTKLEAVYAAVIVFIKWYNKIIK